MVRLAAWGVTSSIGVWFQYAVLRAVTKPVTPGPFCAIAIAILPVERVKPSHMRPPLVSCATSQNLMPALGKRSEIGMNAEPMMPNALSMPCCCSTLMKASSVVIFMSVSDAILELSGTEHLAERLVDGRGDPVDVARRGDERRTQAQGVVESRERAVGGADDDALRHAFSDHRLDPLLLRRLACLSILNQLRAAEESESAHIADHRVTLLKLAQVSHQTRAHRERVLEQALVLDDAHVLERRGGSGGAAAEGRDVAKVGKRIARIILEEVEHGLGGHHAGNSGIARGDAFRHGHEIGLDAVMLIAEPFARAADATDDLIDVQQDMVPAADVLHALPVAGRRGDHATSCRDGLEAQRTDGVRALAHDHLLDGLGGALAIVGDLAILAAILEAMRHLDEAGHGGAILQASLRLSARRERGERGAVIIALAIEDLPFASSMMAMRHLPHHLEDFLVGLGARVGVVHAAEAGHLLGGGLLETQSGDRAGGACEVVHLDQLITNRLRDALPAVAHVHRPHAARHRIEVLPPRRVPELHSPTFDENARILAGEALMLGEMVPNVRPVGVDDVAQLVGAGLGIHGVQASGAREDPFLSRGSIPSTKARRAIRARIGEPLEPRLIGASHRRSAARFLSSTGTPDGALFL